VINNAHDAQMYVGTHKCAECGGWLRTPFKDGGWEVVCGTNKDHIGQAAKADTKFLLDPVKGRVEYDVMTQQEKGATAAIVASDEKMMQRRVEHAVAIGKFPGQTTPEQRLVLANVAWAYGLDPIMGELIPFHGQPYITINGRRRLDTNAGHNPSIAFRFLTAEERQGYMDAEAMVEGDLVRVCILTTEHGNTVEGIGTSYKREAGGNTPSATHRMEMADKRAETRARIMAYGPVPRPSVIDDGVVVLDDDDENTIEGTATVVAGSEAYTPASDAEVEALQMDMDHSIEMGEAQEASNGTPRILRWTPPAQRCQVG